MLTVLARRRAPGLNVIPVSNDSEIVHDVLSSPNLYGSLSVTHVILEVIERYPVDSMLQHLLLPSRISSFSEQFPLELHLEAQTFMMVATGTSFPTTTTTSLTNKA